MHGLSRIDWLVVLTMVITAALGGCTSAPTLTKAQSTLQSGGTPSSLLLNSPGPSPTSVTRSPNPTTTGDGALPEPTGDPDPLLPSSPKPSPTRGNHTTATPTPLACLKSGGRIETGQLNTELLRLPLEFRVYLPPCYDHQPERRYPVLYLIHGQSYTDDQWDRLGADETADALIAAGEAPPFLIVMPRDRVWSQPTEDLFGQAVIQELLPWIDGHYRTQPQREFRAVGGLSRGAGWAIHLGLSAWESFGAIGAHSLPVFWTDLPHIKKWLDSIPSDSLPRIYLDASDNERPQILRSARWFEELLTEKNIPHEWHLYPGYHEEAYWQAHVEEYLRWYTQAW